MRDFLPALQASGFTLFIADGDMPDFCGSVLPTVGRFLELTGQTDRLEPYLPDDPEIEIQLDSPEQMCIRDSKRVYPESNRMNALMSSSRTATLTLSLIHISFLLDTYEDIAHPQRGSIGSLHPRIGRELLLSPSGLDRFFSVCEGQEIALRDDAQDLRPLRLTAGNPALTLDVQRSDVKQGFQLSSDPFAVLCGTAYIYICLLYTST